jgi:hypothetical protein
MHLLTIISGCIYNYRIFWHIILWHRYQLIATYPEHIGKSICIRNTATSAHIRKIIISVSQLTANSPVANFCPLSCGFNSGNSIHSLSSSISYTINLSRVFAGHSSI